MTELDAPASVERQDEHVPFTLPEPVSISIEPPQAMTSAPEAPTKLRTTWLLLLTIASAAGASSIAALQMARSMTGDERIAALTPVQIAAALVAAAGVLTWTWMVVENARRLLAAGRTAEAPIPRAVAASWAMPLLIGIAAVGSIAFLERRLNTIDADTTSVVPLALTLFFLVAGMLVSYRPLFMLSAILRRLGAASGSLSRWIWVPISLVLVGSLTLLGLRLGGAFGDDFEGVVPAWALGIVALPPVAILHAIAWRGGRSMEDAVEAAYIRRVGREAAGAGVGGRANVVRNLFRVEPGPSVALDGRRRLRLVPGAEIFRLSLMIAVSALALVSIVGALVMFLFWRESTDGAVLPSQRDRAWTALDNLQSLERLLAVGFVAVASIWAFVSVLNARLASGRRRNPLLAAAAWPAAAYAIWFIGVRFNDSESMNEVVMGYAAQTAALYVPFFLLERAAITVGARRGPLRLTYALGAALLIHVQGLGGLPTIVEVTEVDRFGRLAGYLALAAILELILTIAVTDASHLINDNAAAMADKHNFLAEQRNHHDERARASATQLSQRAAAHATPVPAAEVPVEMFSFERRPRPPVAPPESAIPEHVIAASTALPPPPAPPAGH
ncbi:MAG: hypothetical protein AB8G14_01770 [Ilumatobacter sp.]